MVWRGDQQIVAATKDNPLLEIVRLPESSGIYRLRDNGTGVSAYFAIDSDEKLTGPIRSVAECGGVQFLPDWVALYPEATNVSCLILDTDAKQGRKVASFLASAEDAGKIHSFFHDRFGESQGDL